MARNAKRLLPAQVLAALAVPWTAFAKGAATFIGIAIAVVAVVAAVAVLAATPAFTAALGAGQIGSAVSAGFSALSPISNFGILTVVSTAGALTNTVGVGMCIAGTDSPMRSGCGGGGSGGGGDGGGGSGSAASGLGSTGTCIAGYYVCGNKTCVPVGSVCCAGVGIIDKYCPSGYICQTDGTCKSGGSAAPAPTSSFSASSGGQSVSAGGSLSVTVGNPIALSWTSTDATACEISQGVGGVNAAGSVNITCNQPGEFQTTLRCAGQGGEVTKSINVLCSSVPKVKEIKPE